MNDDDRTEQIRRNSQRTMRSCNRCNGQFRSQSLGNHRCPKCTYEINKKLLPTGGKRAKEVQ